MIYLNLFLGFLRVGCFDFGGAYGACPCESVIPGHFSGDLIPEKTGRDNVHHF